MCAWPHVVPWCVQDIKFNVHAHPTLSEVLDELFKGAHVEAAPSKVSKDTIKERSLGVRA